MPASASLKLPLLLRCGGRDLNTPACVLNGVKAQSLESGRASREYDAMIDTGAEMTVVPGEIIEELQVRSSFKNLPVTGAFGDKPPDKDGFYVQLIHPAFGEQPLELLVLRYQKPKILLGRDVLSGIHIPTSRKIRVSFSLIADYYSSSFTLRQAPVL